MRGLPAQAAHTWCGCMHVHPSGRSKVSSLSLSVLRPPGGLQPGQVVLHELQGPLIGRETGELERIEKVRFLRRRDHLDAGKFALLCQPGESDTKSPGEGCSSSSCILRRAGLVWRADLDHEYHGISRNARKQRPVSYFS